MKLEIMPKTQGRPLRDVCVYRSRDDVSSEHELCVKSSSYVLWHAIEPVSRG